MLRPDVITLLTLAAESARLGHPYGYPQLRMEILSSAGYPVHGIKDMLYWGTADARKGVLSFILYRERAQCKMT